MARTTISRPVAAKVATCAQPCGPRASELGHGTCRRRRIPRRADEGNQGWPRCLIRPRPRRTARPECRQTLLHDADLSSPVGWCSPARPKAIATQIHRQSMPLESVVLRPPSSTQSDHRTGRPQDPYSTLAPASVGDRSGDPPAPSAACAGPSVTYLLRRRSTAMLEVVKLRDPSTL